MEFFCSVFSRIRTRKTPNTDAFHAVLQLVKYSQSSVQIQEKIDQKKLRIQTIFKQYFIEFACSAKSFAIVNVFAFRFACNAKCFAIAIIFLFACACMTKSFETAILVCSFFYYSFSSLFLDVLPKFFTNFS